MCSLQNGSWAGGRWGVKVGFSRFIMGGGGRGTGVRAGGLPPRGKKCHQKLENIPPSIFVERKSYCMLS